MDARSRLPVHREPIYELDDRLSDNGFALPGHAGHPPSYYTASIRAPSAASSHHQLRPSTPRQFQFSDERIPTQRKVPEPYIGKEKPTSKSKTRLGLWALLVVFFVAAAVVLPVFFFIIRPDMNKSSSNSSSADDTNNGNSSSPSNGTSDTPSSAGNETVNDSPLVKPNRSDPSSLGIPESALGTYFDSTKWLDWTDFNVTYTDVLVGGLPIMVLTS
jgi:hypothetical protein